MPTQRTFVVIRHWLLNYFVHDFIPSRQLRITLTSFINQLAFHPLVRQSVRDQRIVKGLKKVVRRLKRVYYRKAASSHVRIISPPPVTPEQEQIEKLVRGKLLQNSVRRSATTSLGGKFKWAGAKINGNTAISDANMASVVVIGNLNGKGGSSTNLTSDATKKLFGKRAISMTDIRSSVLSAPIRRSVGNPSEDNIKFVSIKTLQMQRRAEIERQQSEAEREYERQRRMEGRPLSIASDDSLESELSAGTTDNGMDQCSEANDSIVSKDKNFEEEELEARELEIQRRKLEEEEEIKRVEFYAQGDIPPTPNDEKDTPRALDIFNSPHAHTVHLDRAREIDVTDGKSSTASADAVMITSKKPAKRPGLPDFLADAAATNPSTVQDNITASVASDVPLPSMKLDGLNLTIVGETLPAATIVSDQASSERRQPTTLQGNAFPSGLAKELSQKSIERRRSERDLRQLYLKSDKDVDNQSFAAEPVPVLPKQISKVDQGAQSSSSEKHLASESSNAPEDFEQRLRRTPSGRFVNMIAEELRREAPEDCSCVACQGIDNDTSNCKRLSTLLSTDVERRHSIELRHRRGASVDRLSEVTKASTVGGSYEVIHFQGNSQIGDNGQGEIDQRSSAIKATSTHLSSEEADTIASLPYVERSSVPILQDIDLLRQPDKTITNQQPYTVDLRYAQLGRSSIRGLERMPSVVSALRTVQLKEQHSDIYSEVAELAVASSSGGGQDAMSEPTTAPVPEKMVNHGHQKRSETARQSHRREENPVKQQSARNSTVLSINMDDTVPQSASEANQYWRRSFILYERSELIAQQLCLVERDVLLAVQWEELVHCRWTKMNTNDDEDVEDPNPRSSRFDSSLQHGVQDAIQRFNVVCQWVASEIVRTPGFDDRVRTIEKFIRIAQVSKRRKDWITSSLLRKISSECVYAYLTYFFNVLSRNAACIQTLLPSFKCCLVCKLLQ